MELTTKYNTTNCAIRVVDKYVDFELIQVKTEEYNENGRIWTFLGEFYDELHPKKLRDAILDHINTEWYFAEDFDVNVKCHIELGIYLTYVSFRYKKGYGSMRNGNK